MILAPYCLTPYTSYLLKTFILIIVWNLGILRGEGSNLVWGVGEDEMFHTLGRQTDSTMYRTYGWENILRPRWISHQSVCGPTWSGQWEIIQAKVQLMVILSSDKSKKNSPWRCESCPMAILVYMRVQAEDPPHGNFGFLWGEGVGPPPPPQKKMIDFPTL